MDPQGRCGDRCHQHSEAFACLRCARLGSPVGIAFVVLLLVAMPFAELILVLADELHLGDRWCGNEQEQ